MTLPPSLDVAEEKGSCSIAVRARVADPIRTRAEDVAPQKKPTPIRKGYWRNHWRTGNRQTLPPECSQLGDGTHLGRMRHVSAEIAEAVAVDEMARRHLPRRMYLGPVFFPAEGGEQ